jgi:hypothetical protein
MLARVEKRKQIKNDSEKNEWMEKERSSQEFRKFVAGEACSSCPTQRAVGWLAVAVGLRGDLQPLDRSGFPH